MIKALVISENYKQYRQWCDKCGFDPKEFKYIRDFASCLGYHNLNILLVEKYWKGVNYQNVANYVQCEERAVK